MNFDVRKAKLPKLFEMYREILRELKDRKIVRTENAPAGDFAEYLVAKALRGKLMGNSAPSYDIKTPSGHRIQVKCRVRDETKKNPRTQLSVFRSLDFDEVAIVLLNPDYTVQRAVLVPAELVKRVAIYRQHVNGHIIHARSTLLDAPGNTDITKKLRRVNGER